MKKVQYDKNKSDSVPIEVYKTRCLGYIERVNELKYLKPDDLENARKKLFNVYFYLQSVSGPERQTPHQTEISIEVVSKALDQAVADDFHKRTGGLGYSVARGLTLTEERGEPINHYFRKVKKSPVYSLLPPIEENKIVIKQTMQEWRNEMAKQKKEILDELSRLRIETSNTPKTSSDL
tara:strand:- start:591 stop:1127 length:537 start_codon:yes stop_codon:yes gene_type:complete